MSKFAVTSTDNLSGLWAVRAFRCLCRVVFASDFGGINLRGRQLQLHLLHRCPNNLRDGKNTEPFVVRRDDVPRRMVCACFLHRVLNGRDVVWPKLALGVVRLTDLLLPRRIVEPLLEAGKLFLRADV
jgi:hypothetical protein